MLLSFVSRSEVLRVRAMELNVIPSRTDYVFVRSSWATPNTLLSPERTIAMIVPPSQLTAQVPSLSEEDEVTTPDLIGAIRCRVCIVLSCAGAY